MKYLKTFNEELNPQTYRNAGGKFAYYGKEKNSDVLYDFADEKEFGFYNATVCQGQSLIEKDAKLTEANLTGIYCGYKPELNGDDNLLKWGRDTENDLNMLVENWKNGTSSLSLCFEFSFRPSRESKRKNQSINKKYKIPFIILEVKLSDYDFGIDEWDSESRWEAEQRGDEFTPSTVADVYEFSKDFSVYTQRPVSDVTYGLFTDRTSAQKFKSFVNSILDEKMKPHIMEVLSIVGGTSQDLENTLSTIRNIKIHGLYQQDVRSSDTVKNLYDKQL